MNDDLKPSIIDDPADSSLSISAARRRIDEIHNLEQKIVDLKQDLIFNAVDTLQQATEKTLKLLLLRVAGKIMAAPIAYMDEVLQMPALLSISEKFPALCGLVDFHGEMIAVVDVTSLAGGRVQPYDSTSVLVICTVGQRRLAILAEEAIEVVVVEREAITISDQILPGAFRTIGMVKLKDSSRVQILDLAWLAMGLRFTGITANDSIIPTSRDDY